MTRQELILAALLPRHRGMARLPGGTFRMGSDGASAKAFSKAGPGMKSILLAETPASDVTALSSQGSSA